MRNTLLAAIICGLALSGNSSSSLRTEGPEVKFDFEGETVGQQPKTFLPIVGNFVIDGG